jgi:dipeptidyl aminopeptidase/acylaminoacyl peptidase
LGASYDDIPDVWDEASAIQWIDGDEPPFLLIHGEIDSTIPPEYSELFAQALNDVGVEADVKIVVGAAHSAILRDPDLVTWIEDFIVRILVK